ncbi:unnamed protein product [marine sediment metagenome]|uniref:Uncharacterized protein n=1 Tax=marine sediment metagenome TaxID=412755 RepID=X1CTC6_9ZZZZ
MGKLKSTPTPNHTRNRAIEYLKTWLGTPYIIGGDDFQGLDCSGPDYLHI